MVRSVRGHMVFSKNCPALQRQRPAAATRAAKPVTGRASRRARKPSTCAFRAGVADGARVRVAGKGHAGVRGGEPGDLYIDVEVGRIRCSNASTTTCTSPCRSRFTKRRWARASRSHAGRADAPARAARARSRVNASDFASAGFPRRAARRRGDLVVEVRIMLPKVLDERSKELLRDFGRINGESVATTSSAPNCERTTRLGPAAATAIWRRRRARRIT